MRIMLKSLLKQTVDKVYCIHLERRLDRLECITQEFKKYGILDIVELWPATPSVDNSVGDNIATSCSVFETACATSHINIIKHAKQNNFKSVLIFEDDVRFEEEVFTPGYADKKGENPNKRWLKSDPVEYLYNALTQLKKIEWDMFFLGYRLPNKLTNEEINYKEISKNIFQATNIYSTHAYIVRDTAYDIILKNSPIGRCAIDKFYAEYISYKIRACCIKPMICSQLPGLYSDNAEKELTNSWIRKNIRRFYSETSWLIEKEFHRNNKV